MANVAIQFFSFDLSRKTLELIRAVDAVVENLPKTKFVFQLLDGTRKSISVGRLLDGDSWDIHFNEGYLQIPPECFRRAMPVTRVEELLVHFSVSPNCALWRHSKDVAGTPAATHVIARNVESIERAARNRSPRLMPTVLEMTFKTLRTDIDALLNESSELVKSVWPSVNCPDKTAVVDVGGEWLFFPKSGYNPNVSDLHLYFCVDTFESWQTARVRHNISFASDPAGQHLPPVLTIHDTVPRRQSHV